MKIFGIKITPTIVAIIIVLYFATTGNGGLQSAGMTVAEFGCSQGQNGPFKCSAASPMAGGGVSFECRKPEGNKQGFACSIDVEAMSAMGRRNPMNPDITERVNPAEVMGPRTVMGKGNRYNV